MEIFYPLLLAFVIVFLSELGDKTQLLVLSFSAKLKTFTILLGVALGSLLSHGIAIMFGSFIGSTENITFQIVIKYITYISFIILGLITIFLNSDSNDENKKISKISKLKIHYCIIVAISIAIGEIGDKTFLASLGLGIEYYDYKISLIIGAILGMVSSNVFAIFLGKFISKRVSPQLVKTFSGVLFITFGLLGIFCRF